MNAKLIVVPRSLSLFLLILVCAASTALCQSGPPPLPPMPWLDSYSFDETNWLSDWGYAPIGFTNLACVTVWDGNALLLDTTNLEPAYLNYRIVETNGVTNLAFPAGTMVAVFINTWASADTNQNGTGPGDIGYLLAAGDFTSNSPDGLWRVWVDQAGTNLSFGGVSNGTSATFVSAPISWPSNAVHLLGIAYQTNGTTMYLDGAQVATGSPVSIVPATNVWSNGFFVGSDASGYEQARAVFWDLEFGNSNCFTLFWSNMFRASYFTNWWPSISNQYYAWLGNQGGGFGFFGGSSLPPDPTYSVNTNYVNYTNFWLTVSNITSNINVRVVNTLSNVTYQILTNRDLTTTNWGIWVTFKASNSITLAPAMSVSSNPFYFNARMVWSTCTNYSPALPDWWTQLYFGSTACVDPAANPTGDGIDNWDKYLLGLSPNIAYVSPLIITPPGGNYVATPGITIFSLAGKGIRYTVDGSIPSSTNGIFTSSGVSLTNLPGGNFTLKAWERGGYSNVPALATYTIIPATPTFSIPGGVYTNGTPLQINCATTNATVRYTTNGIDPTTNSASILPTNVLTLTANKTVKAAAWLGTNVSPVASASYIIDTPPANDNYSNAIVLSGSSGAFAGSLAGSTTEAFEQDNPIAYFFWADLSGNSVWYQWTAPSNGNVFFDCSKCDPSSFVLTAYDFPATNGPNPTNLFPAGYGTNIYGGGGYNYDQGPYYYPNDSTSYTLVATQGVAYWFSASDYNNPFAPFAVSWQYAGLSVPPIFSPDAGTYQSAQVVTVMENDTNAIIHYTLDGSSPTTNSAVIVSGSALTMSATTTLKAAAWRPGLQESAIKTALYTINSSSTNPTLTASVPILSPANSTFTNSMTVTLACTNAGAAIFYTLDGSVPTTASANVASGGTVTVSNSAIMSASAFVTNMNLSPITTGTYLKSGADTDGDGIPDTAEWQIGSNPFASDAQAVNPNPFAHGLNNMQVYQNPSVLLADNYSTENDGIPDWWLVKNGYSVTTPATALGANGQTLLASYVAGLNPNNPSSQPGQTSPIDFHIVHGPTNSLVLVLDTVRPGMASYSLTCVNTDQGLPGVIEEFPPDRAMDYSAQSAGRYFQVTNVIPPGYWYFTLQGVNSNGIASQMSSNTLAYNQIWDDWVPYLWFSPDGNVWTSYSGMPIPLVGYTNKNSLKEQLLTQMLRQESDVSVNGRLYEGAVGWADTPIVYNDAVPTSVTTETSWGTLAFAFDEIGEYYINYHATDYASYFTAFCATPDLPYDCAQDYTNWYGPGLPGSTLAPLQLSYDVNTNAWFVMPDDSWGTNYRFNPAGLEYLSVTYRIDAGDPVTLYPGQSNTIPNGAVGFEAALNTETPSFQPTNYYFDGRRYPLGDYEGMDWKSSPPEDSTNYIFNGWEVTGFFNDVAATSVTNPVIIAQVGKPVNLQGWSQVLAVRPNGEAITNPTYFIDQDFDQAYLCDPVTGDVPRTNQVNYNGRFKINTNAAVKTGILSQGLDYTNVVGWNYYFGTRGADFTPTKPGKVIVTTMPDDNGFYGEVTIYVIDMQVDANHDGVMDNCDLTSVDNPMNFWVNNDCDRWHTVDVTDSEQDDLQINDSSLASWQQVPDCQYQDAINVYAIPCTRDLEDYTRIWIPGLSNLMQELPPTYGVNLVWRNNTGAGIRIFEAAESDGSTNYLFDVTTASNQISESEYPCIGYVTPTQTISLNNAFTNFPYGSSPPGEHYIFCGTTAGNDELVLQITNQYGGEVGEASVFLNLQDIKQMYERWSVGEDPSAAPNTIATNAGDDGCTSFQYPYDSGVNSTTPYILYVHGWNLPVFEKDRNAETMFKRLYWQGYQGRFGLFRWPTYYAFPLGELSLQSVDLQNFDNSEFNAWESGVGLKNRLASLNIQYPNQVYVMAHSQGNVVTGEALRLAGANQLVSAYVAMQAAVPSHAYDPTSPTRSLGAVDSGTPNCYAAYWTNGAPCYFNAVSGAGNYVNFYNTNDWALTQLWPPDQDLKPDAGFGYSSGTFYATIGDGVDLVFPKDTYTIFAFCDEARCNALGAQANVAGVFQTTKQIELDGAPYNFGGAHKYHSGEFRSDNMNRGVVWNAMLVQMKLKK